MKQTPIEPREKVKYSVVARIGTLAAALTWTLRGSRSSLVRWTQRRIPNAASSPSTFQYDTG